MRNVHTGLARLRDRVRERLRLYDGGPWPVLALAVTVALGLVQSVELLAPLCWPALVLLAYAAGRRMRSPLPMVWFFAALAVAGLPLCAVVGRELWAWPTLLLTALLAMGLPWLVGRYLRQRAELAAAGWRIADRLEREQRAVADRARIRERARIAGDMHDSLGHELALLAVRAGALELDPALDTRQRTAAGELRESAATATERLREIIGVLRTDDEPPPVAPAEETVEELVERAVASGVAVVLEREGEAGRLPPMVGHAVHRVVQEGVTNAAKHAPGAEVHVRLAREDGTVEVTVRNGPVPHGARPPGLASGGTGLVGLDERVRLTGGTLRTGATPDGGFELAARLPAHGAVPRAAGTERDTASARELAHARRQVRRRLRQTVLVPLAALAAILVLMLPVSLVSSALSVLDRADYDRLKPGMSRAEVEKLLPPFTRDGPPDGAPRPPRGQSCAYYSPSFNSSSAYRLCFAADRLISKARYD
ncbi:histidine kinase [Streptomyces sp. NPDC048172]|uniref:histidine kinase n=1 Tax=Streptomyces sp. NPDC048172 TaxID=3365505 RepID=UPI0037245F35